MRRLLAPLRESGFRYLVAGQLISNLGDGLYAVALPWYVLERHGGVLLLGVVLAAYGIPRTVLLAVGGHLSDRLRPWTVMLAADGVRAAVVAVLATVAAAGPAQAWLLVPIAVLLGAGEGTFVPGSFAIVPALLPDQDLQAGNSLTSGGTQLAALFGPALGGLTVALVGPSTGFAIDACTFAVSALTLIGVRRSRTATRPADGEAAHGPDNHGQATHAQATHAQATHGQDAHGHGANAESTPPRPAGGTPTTLRRLLATEPALRLMLMTTIVANLGSGGLSGVALPALARGPLGLGAGGYGAIVAAMGGGMLLGTLVAAGTQTPRRPAVISSSLDLVAAGSLCAIPYLGGAVGAATAVLAFGILIGFSNVVVLTAFQRWAPAAMMGRLMGLMMLSGMGVYPLSVMIGGVVVHGFGSASFFPLSGVSLAIAALVSLSSPSWRAFGASGVRAQTSSAELGAQ